jgi:hypothetical protein
MNVRKSIRRFIYNPMFRESLLIGLLGGIGGVCVDASDHIGPNPTRDLHIPILILAIVGIILFTWGIGSCLSRFHPKLVLKK